MKTIFSLLLFCCAVGATNAQFTHADSLRGGYGNTRNWWDLKHYDLHVTFNSETKEIHGHNTIKFSAEERISDRHTPRRVIQLDLQAPMSIDSIRLVTKEWHMKDTIFHYNELITKENIKQVGNAWFAELPEEWLSSRSELTVYFHGKPREAVQAPWDGGVVWAKDENGKPWITIACQGLGASVWFPCKDSQIDEPDNGVQMHYTCDSKLKCVSNGHFLGSEEHKNGTTTFSWEVKNPINNYNMIPYIGDYVNIHDHFQGEKGMLELDYWVLRGYEAQAEKQFMDAPRTLEALEYWFGPYAFYEDGYKLVHAPHLGMEHQSGIAYGNGFENGYLGTDLSGTGEGLKWDFIIVHESGHEWFGNNITSKDIADMWIHESFTNYGETLFMDYWCGTEHANKYCIGMRKNIKNDIPIIGQYGVNSEGSGDMYYKGSNMLHTIRQITNNDTLFRMLLRELNAKFYHQTVTTAEIETFMSAYLKLELKTIFDQYLRTKNPPTLEMKHGRKKMKYRWINCVPGFQMSLKTTTGEWITPSTKWKKMMYNGKGIPFIDENFYINTKSSIPKMNRLRVG
ncbi:MAG: peptidase M1 [Candidatus Fluviicola riflensis]|nr:MAG: peptidase M1 [Candidatus Fluviicola riflensis]OGS78929.1 MAG: peptidase M1 [Candidatus Fluviicola riflensis]OGS85951.1 MAG: peptidase M1 [Fluviicola sp. RIFCSPHIGHO2_12_FULL_43_24]OGS86360.1 MAG: peptidase M1 [Fluviicola sp. RIFCSPHIGHO2_01_FULL_43_53]